MNGLEKDPFEVVQLGDFVQLNPDKSKVTIRKQMHWRGQQ